MRSSTAGRSCPTTGATPASGPSTRRAGGDTKTPLVVLVDGGTASAAEIVTAALQDRGRAVVVGSRTYGKGSVQEPARLEDGSAIEITVGKYVTPVGPRRSTESGIEPDITVDAAESPRCRRDPRARRTDWSGRRRRPRRQGLTRCHARRAAGWWPRTRRRATTTIIEDTFEAGLVLTGTEVKSLRAGRASLVDGFATGARRRDLAAQRAHPGVQPGHVEQPRAAPGAQAAAEEGRDPPARSARPRSPG